MKIKKASSPAPQPPEAPRRYRSPLRANQAAETRRRILEAAGHCFAEHGYVGTTLPDIATAAGVSVETVHAHGPKSALLLAAFEQTFALREGKDSILDRPEMADVFDQLSDPVEFIRFGTGFIADATARSARLWLAFYHAASADPSIRDAYQSLDLRIRDDLIRFVAMVSERGGLRRDRPAQLVADELGVLAHPTVCETLCENSGWSLEAYRDYVFENACRILLPPQLQLSEP